MHQSSLTHWILLSFGLILIVGLFIWGFYCQPSQSSIIDDPYANYPQLYIAKNGNDTWTGSLRTPQNTDGPLRTLEGARQRIREIKSSNKFPEQGLVVTILADKDETIYTRMQSFTLSKEDSGTPTAPIIYRGEPGATIRISGGIQLMGCSHPTIIPNYKQHDRKYLDQLVVCKLDPEIQSKLGSYRVRGFGKPSQSAAMELFLDHQPLTPARFPNYGYLHIEEVPNGKDGGMFTYHEDRIDQWANQTDVWLHGYWTWDWADSYINVKRIHAEKNEIWTHEPHGVYGYKPGGRFYAFNIAQELDHPGEWYLDKEAGQLAFIPPISSQNPIQQIDPTNLFDPNNHEIAISMIEEPLFSLEDVSFVRFEGLHIELGRSAGIVIKDGSEVQVNGCVVRNLGTTGVELQGGNKHRIQSSTIYNTGEQAIVMIGGERKTLTPGNHLVDNNHLHHFARWCHTYHPGITIKGVGNTISHNRIHHAPHTAILLNGNEHIIEYNNIYQVCEQTGDAGAFYMGRDWTQRGVIIRHNWFHHLHGVQGSSHFSGVQGVYLDDWTSGIQVEGNIFEDCPIGLLIGGGRDNTVLNNLFINCEKSIHVDARGKAAWTSYYFDGTNTTLFDRLDAMDHDNPPYSVRYPKLATILEDDPAFPKGNVIHHNVHVGSGAFYQFHDDLTESDLDAQDNIIDQKHNPTEILTKTYAFRSDSPIQPTMDKPIPFKQIGLYTDAFRKDIPPSHPVSGRDFSKSFLSTNNMLWITPENQTRQPLSFTLTNPLDQMIGGYLIGDVDPSNIARIQIYPADFQLNPNESIEIQVDLDRTMPLFPLPTLTIPVYIGHQFYKTFTEPIPIKRRFPVKTLDAAPVIDGMIDDLWEDVIGTTEFGTHTGHRTTVPPTRILFASNGSKLYALIEAQETNMSGMQTTAFERDKLVQQDDCMGFFFAHPIDSDSSDVSSKKKQTVYQIYMNTHPTIYDGYFTIPLDSPTKTYDHQELSWDAAINIAVKKHTLGWVMEWELDLESLGIAEVIEGMKLLTNFRRKHPQSNQSADWLPNIGLDWETYGELVWE